MCIVLRSDYLYGGICQRVARVLMTLVPPLLRHHEIRAQGIMSFERIYLAILSGSDIIDGDLAAARDTQSVVMRGTVRIGLYRVTVVSDIFERKRPSAISANGLLTN